jgi:hypothetical protein
MSISTELLLLQISKYIDLVYVFNMKLFEIFGTDDPLLLYHSGEISKTNTIMLNNRNHVHYDFHGKGCRLKFLEESIKVDFDYGPNGEINLFDPWRIFVFLKENKIVDAISLTQVKEKFSRLENEGYIEPVGDKEENKQYFLTSNFFLS